MSCLRVCPLVVFHQLWDEQCLLVNGEHSLSIHDWSQTNAKVMIGDMRSALHLIEEIWCVALEHVRLIHSIDELFNGEETFVIEAPHTVCSGPGAHVAIKFDDGGLVYHFAQAKSICQGKVPWVFLNRLETILVFFLLENDFEVVDNTMQRMCLLSTTVWAREADGHHLETRWAVSEYNILFEELESRVVEVARLNHNHIVHIVSVAWIHIVQPEQAFGVATLIVRDGASEFLWVFTSLLHGNYKLSAKLRDPLEGSVHLSVTT